MAENMIKFLRGNVASLPSTATAGAVYFTKDEGLYLGLADGTYHRYGDFIEVANVDSLPAEGAHIKAMYYCTAENILAKWNGTKWVQINKQQTLAELGGVAKSVYEAKMAVLEKADTDNATAIAGVDTRLQAAEEKLKSVATTEGLGELTRTVEGHTALIDTINGDVNTAGSMLKIAKDAADAKDAAIEAAQNAADKAQGDVDALAGTHATDKAALEGAIALKANIADVYTKGDIDGKVDTINGAIDLKANAADVYTKGDIDGKVSALEDADEAINNLIGDVTEGKTVVEMIADAGDVAAGEIERLEGLIGDNADAIAQEVTNRGTAISDLKEELEGKIDVKADQTALDAEVQRATGVEGGFETRIKAIEDDHLKAADKTELQGNIDTLTGVVEALRDGVDAEKVDGVIDLINYVEEHGAEVTGMKEDIADNAQAIVDEAARASGAEEALGGRIDTLSGVVDGKAAQADLEDLDGRVEVAEGKITTLEGEMDAVEGRATTLEGKVANLETASATHATKDELQAVSDVAEAAVTVEEMNAAISAAGHASQTDLTAHIDDAVKHITADERTAWNGAVSDLSAHKTAYDAKVAELVAEDADIRVDFAAADATLKTQMEAYADQAELDAVASAKLETESQVAAAKQELNGKIDTNIAAIAKINGDVNTDGSFAKADAAVLADAKAYSDEKLENAMTWGEF